jgi:hypothetical protein
MSSTTRDDIFPVVIDKKLTIEDLGSEIRKVRQDLQEKNFDLYKKDFFK